MIRKSFFDVPRSVHTTSEGPVKLPILYRDVTNVIALFLVPHEGAEELLVGTGLVADNAGRQRVLAALSFYEYRDTSIGSYNEVGTAIFARRDGEPSRLLSVTDTVLPAKLRRSAAWVVDLPVTTHAANAAGREIWGYPKFVTDISFRLEGRSVETSVHDPGGTDVIVTLSGELGRGLPAPPIDVVTYTRLDAQLIRTHIDVRGWQTIHSPGSVRLRVGTSEHRMAKNLRTLGLENAVPIAITTTHRFQSKLPAGKNMGTSP
ncbi:MAG: acetoacetate decarboxylase family protein [Polyangiaceae bacterium]|nr:acetoacetate decarboxylase family protein [Polyangiaceae bacterium]